jgi:hypothetical protein
MIQFLSLLTESRPFSSLDSDGKNGDQSFRFLFHITIDAKAANSKSPQSWRVKFSGRSDNRSGSYNRALMLLSVVSFETYAH